MNGVQAGSPLRVDYKDSAVDMYKTLKIGADMDIGEVLAHDNEVDLAGAAELEKTH